MRIIAPTAIFFFGLIFFWKGPKKSSVGGLIVIIFILNLLFACFCGQNFFSKALALWADGFYKSKCPCVCVCVSVCPCVHFLRYHLNVFFPNFLKSDFQFFLEIQNLWGKVMKIFANKVCKIAAQKIVFGRILPLSACLCVRLCVHLSICLFTFEVLFKLLFAPTSKSWMSNIFRDSESLGEKY